MSLQKLSLLGLLIMSSITLTACSRKKTETSINSDASQATITTEDVRPMKLSGAKKLSIQGDGVYLNDDGLQQISLPSQTETGNATKEILNYLDNRTVQTPSLDKDRRQKNISDTAGGRFEVKQLSINIQGSQFELIGGSELFEHISSLHSKISQSGNNLVIQAHPNKKDGVTYLLISDKNPDHYVITNPSDWYNESLFMITKQQYTLLKIQRNDDISNPTLIYSTGKNSYDIGTYGSLLAIPDGTPLTLTFSSKNPNTPLTVLQVSNDPLSSMKADCQQYFKDIPSGTIDQLKSQFSGWDTLANCELVTANTSGEYKFTTKKLLGNDDPTFQQTIIILSPAHSRVISRRYPKFTADLVDTEQYDFPYVKEIISAYQLDYEATDQSLKKILATGEYETRGNGFRYKIQPKKKYEGNLDIKTIFGQSLSLPLSLYIETIDPRVVTQQVLANNTISLLPSSGSFQDVLIQHENIDTLPVSFSPCEVTNNVDRTRKSGQGLENYLFNCDDATYTRNITTKEFKYWKAYRTAVPLPEGFPDSQAFKVTVPNNKGEVEPYYFYKSDIGIWTKVAGDKLHIRGFMFDDNSPITSGTINIQTIGSLQETLATLPIKSTETVYQLPKDEQGNIKNDLLLVTLSNGDQKSFLIVDPQRSSAHYRESSQKSYTINSYLNPQDVVNSNANLSFWGEEYPVKLYAYSDRGLYKAGDSVFVAGFVRDLRNFKNLDYLKGKTVTITANDPQGTQLYSNESLELDDFGGFKASFPLPTSLALGDIMINYQLNGDDLVRYGHNIKVEEYQKPTFFIDTSHSEKNGKMELITNPLYYFGQALSNYDIKISWSLAGKDICAYCRWWNQDSYYYNYVFNDTINTGGELTLYNQTDASLATPLFPIDLLTQKGYQYSLKANITVKDNNSDETQFFTRYIDFNPGVKLGLSGQPYERLYGEFNNSPLGKSNDFQYNENGKDSRKDFTIDGEIKEGKDKIKNLSYEVLYWSYDQDTQQGVDGNIYYLNGNQYQHLLSGSLDVGTNFEIASKFITKPGSYLLRVYATDEQGSIIGEVQKQIEFYEFTNDPDGLLGALPNNYTLTVNIPKKTYEEEEEIPVNIAPYQKGARVIMTVERGNQIIETIEKTLDGSPLTLKVQPGYAPNIVINVMQIVGSDKASGPRKEPRFFVGYGQADISTAMHEMKIEIMSDKEVYKPNEEVKLTLTTKDSAGNNIDARISLGVIDEALMAMYDAKKEPIPYFFNKLGTSIANYTNMKLLYQSLKAFANNGSKGGSGLGGKASFSVIRDDLEDVAFRRGAIYTTGGKAEISFRVPENLTTWVVDAIGISKDTRLGTSQKSFKVSKNLVIEANPPSFVTLGDELQIPVKLIVAPEFVTKGEEIKGNAKLIGNSGEVIDLGSFQAPTNSKILLTTKIPSNWDTSSQVHLILEGSYHNEKDSIQQSIPLRKEGLTMRDSVGIISKAGEHNFTIPTSKQANLTLSLSQFPTNLIDPVIQYLVSYPYGCTEQLLSTLLPLHTALELKKTRKFGSNLINGDFVDTYNGTLNIDAVFSDGISQILNRQNANGSFGLWKQDNTEASIHQYMLTTYIYSALGQLQSHAPSTAALNQARKQAASYLRTHRTLSPEGFLYYLAQKSLGGETLESNEVAELSTMKPQSLKYGALLRYIIAVGQKNTEDMNNWRTLAVVPTNDDQRRAESMMLNQETAYALKLQALSKDTEASQELLSETLQALLSLRQKSGTRSSTQASVQSLLAIAQIAQARPMKDLVNCSVDIDGKTSQHQVNTSEPTVIRESLKLPSGERPKASNTHLKWSCDSVLIADASISYIPESLDDQLGADTHVTKMAYSLSNAVAKLGETIDLNASWTTTIPGEQVAVEIFIPSTVKFLKTIDLTSTPFTVSDYNCQPSHRETKFDRLFLYYENLPAVTCDITIPALKAYNGIPVIQPMRVYEMYRGKVNGRKVIQ